MCSFLSMQLKTFLPLKSVSVPNAIAVLVEEPDYDKRDGITYIKAGDEMKGRAVRVMQAKELRSRDLLVEIAGETPGWVDFLSGIKLLQQLEGQSHDPVVLDNAYRLMAPTLGLDPKKSTPDRFGSVLALSMVLALDGLRVVFWHTKPNKRGDTRLLPGLFAPDLKTANAACWCLAPELRVCTHTHCNRIFLAKRPLQTACKPACREAHRIARFWAKKRGKRGKVAA
jgi:hypothetical protein